MFAIQYNELGSSDVLNYTQVNKPSPKDGEVLIELKAASLNHLDLHFRRGLPGMKSPLPHIPGSDGAGIVVQNGSLASKFNKGDRVLINPGMPCGICDRCKNKQENLCHQYRLFGRENNGTYAQYTCVPEQNLLPIPSGVDFYSASAFALTYLTAWSMLMGKAQLKPKQTVLVMGAGSGVSCAAIQIAKFFKCTVFTTASTQEKRQKAKDLLQVDECIDYTKVAIDKEIRSLTDKQGVDVIIDHVGGEQWVPLLKSARNGGKIISCGATAGFDPKTDLRHIFYRQVQILGSTMGTWQEMQDVYQHFIAGHLKPIIDSVFPLKDAAKAQDKMENRQSFGKIVLDIPY
ncbi:MAG TPA: zinc-binding dehydrogenase [Oligoflexia bacterium]|nr:zinc-binding dehydrogenase [Oligoflexia bacterium]HMR23792.1 zinc-binding dehydrogenase [Oligoflexia bacterium]